MAQRCTVCDHPKRAEIDQALVEARAPAMKLATRYRLTERSVRRHAENHLPAALAAAQDAAVVVQGDRLLSRLQAMNAETLAILTAAKESEDHELALKAIARVEKQLELEARLLGELRDGPTVNVFVGAEWQQAVAAILGVLRPHPALRLEVAAALQALAAGGREGQEVVRVA